MNLDILYIYRNIRYYIPSMIKFGIFGKVFKNQHIGKYFLVGKRTIIAKNFTAGNCVQIGAYSYIGPATKIGNFVLISDHVNIIGNDHEYKKVGVPCTLSGRPLDYLELETKIEDDVWIGHGVTILRGVQIGEGSIVASNSVVTKNIKSYSIYGGNPAKFIKTRFNDIDKKVHASFLEDFRNRKFILIHDDKPLYKFKKNKS